MVELIRAAQAEQPDGTTAVLVRSKAHLDHLIHALREAGLSYQAVEIGALAQRPAVLDLLSLTLALLHHGGPRQLAGAAARAVVRSDPGRPARAGRRRTGRTTGRRCRPCWPTQTAWRGCPWTAGSARWPVAELLQAALDERGRRPLRDWVEGAWLALGGPACLPDDAAAEDVEVFFRLLQELDGGAEPLTPERVREGVDALFSLPDPRGDPRLQLMTIHKAKGLEFDTVILPGLGKSTQGDRRKLLHWQEIVGEQGEVELLFGPVKPAHSNEEPRASAYIKRLQAEMGRLENGRLLYVAATRAKRRLHLVGHAAERRDGSLTVDSGSLLSRTVARGRRVWQAVAAGARPRMPWIPARRPDRQRPIPLAGVCPPAGSCPQAPVTVGVAETRPAKPSTGVVYEWAGDTARAVGSGGARLAATPGPARRRRGWPTFHLSTPPRCGCCRAKACRRRSANARRDGCGRLLESALNDERGRWILSGPHEDSRCEVPVTALIDGQLRHLVIDRTFIDAAGTRWIIDYKTGTHLGGDVGGFLDEEQERYRSQLAGYARAFEALENRPVRTALYYPLVRGGWREVSA